MTADIGDDLARVTVISPNRRIDLALPGTTTLGELLPNIVRFAGYEGGGAQDAVTTWALQRFGEDPLDPNALIADLQIRDGETLHLRQQEAALPDAAFDDVVDAVSTTTQRAQEAWSPQDSQRFALLTAAVFAVLLPGAATVLSPSLSAALGALALATAAGFVAILLARAFGQRTVAGVLGWVSVIMAGLGGSYLIAGRFPLRVADLPVQALTGSALLLVFAVAMALGTRVSAYQFLGVALTGLVLALTAMVAVLLGGSLVQVCAVALAVVLGLTALLPMLSYRVANVALPNLPTTAEALMADRQPVQTDIVQRAISADRFLAAFLTCTGLSATVLSIPLLLWGEGPGPVALVSAAAVALALRSRAFSGRPHRFVLLAAGTLLGVAALVRWVLMIPDPVVRLTVGVLVVLIAVWLLVQYAATMYNKVLSPVWGRCGDILEWVAIMCIVPFTLWTLNLFMWAYGLAGS
ncbi:type VII secretion integral membrane protein EccD [Granulicoccus phenolivorans]|uniref:type VII secretion integral membrane protein EccD n=1 Tax=Granulicoccus phenolivorans TaxID=266854 RepID=UPI0004140CB6|nr:type VII secretion integral membrane protein EccD [Granulicoccus phenolivorans]